MLSITLTIQFALGILAWLIAGVLLAPYITNTERELDPNSTHVIVAGLSATIGLGIMITPVSMGALHVVQQYTSTIYLIILFPIICISVAFVSFLFIAEVENRLMKPGKL